MLLVKTHIGPSPIEGIGIFVSEPVKKGTVVWVYDPIIDNAYTDADIGSMPPVMQDTVRKYSYFDNKIQKYILCGDDARFFNHSDNPSCGDRNFVTYAARDMEIGDELTSDYRTFDGKHHEYDIDKYK